MNRVLSETIGLFLCPLHGRTDERRGKNIEGNNGRDIGYYRIERGKEKDPKAVYRTMQKGYGVKHPERISGYAGLFFGTGISCRPVTDCLLQPSRIFDT